MTAPNIVNVSSIVGSTTAISLSTTDTTTILSNASASDKVFKVNTVVAAGIGTTNGSITLKYHLSSAGAGTSTSIAEGITVPANSSLVILGKDSPIYLEEDRSLTVKASATNNISVVCSYEEIQ